MLVGRIPVAALANPPALVELFAETIVEELDFRLEAENMLDIARIVADTNQRALVVPRPHPELVTRRVIVMERLSGFSWDDVAGMKEPASTRRPLRGWSRSSRAPRSSACSTATCTAATCSCSPMARWRCYGITGRLDESRRLAFLRLLMGGTVNDVKLQLGALRDLGALPPETDLDAVIRDLNLDQPVKDPTQMSADELMGEIRELTKALLGYGARLPKELILFVKNMIFLDGSLATLTPDVDIFEEITYLATYFTTHHGERIASDIGIDPRTIELDLDGMKASMGLTPDVKGITHRELQERREIIRKRMEQRRRG